MSVIVSCYSGAFYAERPKTITVDGRLIEIETILSRWRTPEGLFFRVSITQEQAINLFYSEAKDEWEVASLAVNDILLASPKM